MNGITIKKLQKYIKEQDFDLNNEMCYFYKLIEEVGELSKAINNYKSPACKTNFRGSIEEEIYDVIYYALSIANVYNIDVEEWILIKEQYNDKRYNRNHSVELTCD